MQESNFEYSRHLPGDNNLIGRITDYIQNNLEKDLHQKTVAAHFYISVVTLGKLFRKKYQCTYHEYVERERMQRAGHLISKEGKYIKEAMYLTGYRSRATFIRAFKNYFGKTPSSFK